MKTALFFAAMATVAFAQSPPKQTAITIGGKKLSIKYDAPSLNGRTNIFEKGGRISQDPTYPVWRAGANEATSFHTDADLDVGGVHVPKGDYTLYVLLSDPNQWQLIINKQTGQWGLTYNQNQDVGRAKMTMSKPPAPVEQYKMTLSSTGASAGTLQLAWDGHIATVPITAK